ncbi:hypothetical protein [Paenibacillus sp. MDMC362]|uniref:hypothetical protein n=1 Tax=Paenibacillus sp. MDMC362 TaxID=2977365 RepID=UPI001C660614|nr:hypothetical protein [Paenibacillus sp. MDMC362]
MLYPASVGAGVGTGAGAGAGVGTRVGPDVGVGVLKVTGGIIQEAAEGSFTPAASIKISSRF